MFKTRLSGDHKRLFIEGPCALGITIDHDDVDIATVDREALRLVALLNEHWNTQPPQTMTNQPNHHEVNPHYRPQPTNNPDNDAEVFRLAIRDSYAKLNARREAAYESELVPLSSKPGAPLIPQYKLPL